MTDEVSERAARLMAKMDAMKPMATLTVRMYMRATCPSMTVEDVYVALATLAYPLFMELRAAGGDKCVLGLLDDMRELLEEQAAARSTTNPEPTP